MATDIKPIARRLEPGIESLLARLRRRIRAYVAVDGLALAAIVLAAGFWISLGIDWYFELPWPFRAVVLAAVVAAVCHVVYRLLLARLFVRLANRNMALLVERRFGQFQDGLLTTVELAQRPDEAAVFNAEMVEHTRRTALAGASGVDLARIFNTAPLARRATLALALAGSVLVFALALPDAMGVWARRNLLFSAELWPRSTHLYVDGFDSNTRVKIARGADWALAVRADAAADRLIPEEVEVRYSTEDGARGRENMIREGAVLPGQSEYQHYQYTFKSVLSPLEFYVAGGDDREGPFYLDVVESPTVSRMTLHCEYPAYMRRTPRDIPVAGMTQLPRGTRITILAEANKPLVSVKIDDVTDADAATSDRLDIAAEVGHPEARFQYVVPSLDDDKILQFTLHDADGITSLEAVRLALSSVADEPPQVNVQLRGIGTAITPGARLPAAGEIADDYGVDKVWFDFHPDETPARQLPFSAAAKGAEKLSVDDALEVGELALQPKQKLHVAIQAADGCALNSGPNVGTSQRYVLDVVTPEQLRSMLEARELLLRRRFETIIEEFTDTRNLLAGIEGTQQAPQAVGDADAAKTAAQEPDKPADKAPPTDGPNAADQVSRSAVQVARVTQNAERSRHETLAVAEAFDDIRAEMINNRVDTEELKIRLSDGVAEPLKRIVATAFPPLEAELKKLADQLSDPQAAPATRAAAVARMDAILVEMRQVLDKMLELETFNEVLDILREIIDQQEKVQQETKEKQKEKLRDLTE